MEPTPALLYTTAIYDESIHPKLNFEKRLLIDFYDEIIPASDRNFQKSWWYAQRYWSFVYGGKVGDSIMIRSFYPPIKFITLLSCGEYSLRTFDNLGSPYMGRDIEMVISKLHPKHEKTLRYGIETSREHKHNKR